MSKFKIGMINVVYGIAIIAVDLIIFILLSLLLMIYDDNYDPSKGEYWSLESMNGTEKLIYFAHNAWVILNVIGLIYLASRIYNRKMKKSI